MSAIAVPLAITIIGIIWSNYSLKLANREFVRRKKAEIYQLVISSSEELREAYFEGIPQGSYLRPPPGWEQFGDDWSHTDDWIKSDRYLHGAREMNSALAGIALFAPETLSQKCFDLENIAKMPKSDHSRRVTMNAIINMMRDDLEAGKLLIPVNLEWD